MCGIGGYFLNKEVRSERVERAMETLLKRGPDSQGQIAWDRDFKATNGLPAPNGLLASRLAIMDPASPFANQPLSNERRDVWIAYNGELYDWEREAAGLAASGALFRSRADTEFLLRAYERWGIAMIERIHGMFAIAILDLRSREVWLIRDRLGQKPLIYSAAGGELVFGSTVRSVAALRGRGFAPSAASIDAYLAHRYVPAPATIMEGVQRLEPGTCYRFDLQTRRGSQSRYWRRTNVAGDLNEILPQCVERHTHADRPVGLFLSSGVDSSALAVELSRLRKDFVSITAAFRNSEMDEAPDASATARRLGLRHHVVEIPDGIDADFSRIVSDLDEPFADPSAVPTWYLCREAASIVKVVLGGDGLDELLAGYKRTRKHLQSAWRRHLPRIPLRPRSPHAKGWTKLAAELSMTWADAYSLRFSGFTPAQRRFLQPRHEAFPVVHWRKLPVHEQHSALERLQEIDLENYLPEYILRKSDLCGMAHGLEIRAPYLDESWVQAVLALPEKDRMTQPSKKIMGVVVPELLELGVLERKKRGFNPPLRPWINGQLRDRMEGLGRRLEAATSGQLDGPRVELVCHPPAGSPEPSSEQVFQLLVLDESLRQLERTGSD